MRDLSGSPPYAIRLYMGALLLGIVNFRGASTHPGGVASIFSTWPSLPPLVAFGSCVPLIPHQDGRMIPHIRSSTKITIIYYSFLKKIRGRSTHFGQAGLPLGTVGLVT